MALATNKTTFTKKPGLCCIVKTDVQFAPPKSPDQAPRRNNGTVALADFERKSPESLIDFIRRYTKMYKIRMIVDAAGECVGIR